MGGFSIDDHAILRNNTLYLHVALNDLKVPSFYTGAYLGRLLAILTSGCIMNCVFSV